MDFETRKAELINEFPELAQDDCVLQKEVYAHFGLLYFKFALIEHSLANFYIFSRALNDVRNGNINTQEGWMRKIDELEQKAFSFTLGKLIDQTKDIPEIADLIERESEVQRLRNYYAHRFMREQTAYFGFFDGCWTLLMDIQRTRQELVSLDQILESRFSQMCSRFNLPNISEEDIYNQLRTMTNEAIQDVNFRWR